MTRTIKEWQRAAYALADEKGWHSRECKASYCHDGGLAGTSDECPACNGTGRVPIDPHSPTRIDPRLERIHAEISEAGECVARGRMALYFESAALTELVDKSRCTPFEAVARGGKPEGFGIELADVFLRLCDLAESLGAEPAEDWRPEIGEMNPRVPTAENSARMLCELHDEVPRACRGEGERDLDNLTHDLYGAIELTFWCARAHGVDLLAMAELKLEYERSRL